MINIYLKSLVESQDEMFIQLLEKLDMLENNEQFLAFLSFIDSTNFSILISELNFVFLLAFLISSTKMTIKSAILIF